MEKEAPYWRETASQQAQDEVDLLFGECMNFAVQLLSKQKEFYPFSLTLSKDDEIAIVGTYSGEERPLSQDVISDLKDALSSSRDNLRAAVIVDDVKVDHKYDAVRASIEHCEGAVFEIVIPYEIKGIFKKVKLNLTSTPDSESRRI